jgi:hypothetical protein
MKKALASARLMARDAVEAHGLAARVHWATGAHAKAFKSWERALMLGERLGTRPEIARIHRDLARAAADAPPGHARFRDTEPQHWTELARSMFDELGLDAELRELSPDESDPGPRIHRAS